MCTLASVTYLAKVELDPITVRLFLGQTGPELFLQLLFAKNENDGARGLILFGLLLTVSFA